MERPSPLDDLEPAERTRVLELLTATRAVRADAVREFWERSESRHLADAIIQLEVDDDARTEVLAVLKGDFLQESAS
jgi:hypothetical protein